MKNQWQKKRLKFCDTLIMGQSPDGTSVNTDGYGVPFMQGNSEFGELHPSAKLATTEPAKFCSTNDVLISVRAPVGAVNIADKEYAIGRGLCAIRPHQHDSKFLFYLCKIQAEQLNSLATGTTFTAVSTQQVGNLHVWLPPISEQRRIAAYLDQQTAKIDRLMDLRRRQIALLKEQRAALIQQAVTRGLNPNVPMKNSGLPWLEEIPAHWEMVRMKTLAESLIAGPFGSSIKKDMYVNEGYRVYGQEQVIPADFSIGDYFITPEKFIEMERYSVLPGDVLISCVGSFGKIAVVPKNIHPGIINPRLLRLRPKIYRVIPEYLGTVLRGAIGFTQMEQEGRGGTMDVINIALLGHLRLPLPPKNEQMDILEYINDHHTEIDKLHSAYSRQLTLLAEYRAALIHECVIGQRPVPDHFDPEGCIIRSTSL